MEITLNNYEAFLLDYYEGNLSREDIESLKIFSLLHPELDINLDEELPVLETKNHHFENKDNLKVHFDEQLVIGLLENTLNAEEQKTAAHLLQNNSIFKNEYGLYQKTILQADHSVQFPAKENLKKQNRVIVFERSVVFRMAAGLLLMLGLVYLISSLVNNENQTLPKELAGKPDQKNEFQAEKTNAAQSDQNTGTIAPTHTMGNMIAMANETQIKTSNHTVAPKQEFTKEIETIDTNEGVANIDPIIKSDQPVNPPIENKSLINEDSSKTYFTQNNQPRQTYSKLSIEEGVDADTELTSANPKSKAWRLVTKAFGFLHKNGVERLNSSPDEGEISVGALSISKK